MNGNRDTGLAKLDLAGNYKWILSGEEGYSVMVSTRTGYFFERGVQTIENPNYQRKAAKSLREIQRGLIVACFKPTEV